MVMISIILPSGYVMLQAHIELLHPGRNCVFSLKKYTFLGGDYLDRKDHFIHFYSLFRFTPDISRCLTRASSFFMPKKLGFFPCKYDLFELIHLAENVLNRESCLIIFGAVAVGDISVHRQAVPSSRSHSDPNLRFLFKNQVRKASKFQLKILNCNKNSSKTCLSNYSGSNNWRNRSRSAQLALGSSNLFRICRLRRHHRRRKNNRHSCSLLSRLPASSRKNQSCCWRTQCQNL